MTDLLVFTDLDGTLLDHHSYSYEAALPALEQLAEAGCPLIFNSSKTAAEIRPLCREVNNHHPFIVENGSAAYLPEGYFNCGKEPGSFHTNVYNAHTFGPDYLDLITRIHELRSRGGYRFKGFYDLSNEEIARLTGLNITSAAQARQRTAAEPLVWEDSDEALENFRIELDRLKLTLARGGRFYHVMGQTDKAQALQWLTDQYRSTWPDRQWTTVALGDGQNDQAMLEAAEIAVTIPSANGDVLQLSRTNNVICPDLPGPRGWQKAMEDILGNVTKKGV